MERLVRGLFITASLFTVVVVQPMTPAVAQDFSQLSMTAVPKLNPDGIRRVQLLLRERGFNPGPNDGIVGPLTAEAIRRFQDHFGMNASGQVDNQLLFALGAIDLAS